MSVVFVQQRYVSAAVEREPTQSTIAVPNSPVDEVAEPAPGVDVALGTVVSDGSVSGDVGTVSVGIGATVALVAVLVGVPALPLPDPGVVVLELPVLGVPVALPLPLPLPPELPGLAQPWPTAWPLPFPADPVVHAVVVGDGVFDGVVEFVGFGVDVDVVEEGVEVDVVEEDVDAATAVSTASTAAAVAVVAAVDTTLAGVLACVVPAAEVLAGACAGATAAAGAGAIGAATTDTASLVLLEDDFSAVAVDVPSAAWNGFGLAAAAAVSEGDAGAAEGASSPGKQPAVIAVSNVSPASIFFAITLSSTPAGHAGLMGPREDGNPYQG